jgi:cyclic pyranopterin phosphate synthase
VRELGKRVGAGLDELTMTTNATQLEKAAGSLHAAGVRRINVSLDTLDPDRFRHITRLGDLTQVVRGIDAAREAGLKVKINMVALKGLNEDEIEPMLLWCEARGLDLTLIETMPLGEVEEDRTDHYLPLDGVKRELEQRFTLSPAFRRTGGPARYFNVEGMRARLGLITPLTGNFCEGCNRIRVAATGTVYGCLGHDQTVELRDLLRGGGPDGVNAALDELLAGKPKGHDFRIAAARPAVGVTPTVLTCSASSGSIRTATLLNGNGWHNGMRSAVRLAAMIPASSAVCTTAPLGVVPASTAASVSGRQVSCPTAVAIRSVGALPDTSTIRARPASSRWVSPVMRRRAAAAGSDRPANRAGSGCRAPAPAPNPTHRDRRRWSPAGRR